MNSKYCIFPILCFLSSCDKSNSSGAAPARPELASEAPSAEEIESTPERPELPPDISTNVTEVSDEADCGLSHQTWGDLKRSLMKQAELEYKSAEEIEPELHALPYGGYFSLRIPRSTHSALKPDFFSIIVLDTTGSVLERPALGDMKVSPNDYGGAYADTSFALSQFIDLPFEVHVVDRVTKKKSIFRVSQKD